MRVELSIDDDVLSAVTKIAQKDGYSLGVVLSSLAREALDRRSKMNVATTIGDTSSFYGFRPFGSREIVVTNELIDEIRDDEGI